MRSLQGTVSLVQVQAQALDLLLGLVGPACVLADLHRGAVLPDRFQGDDALSAFLFHGCVSITASMNVCAA